MINKSLFALLFVFVFHSSHSQNDTLPKKRYNRYIGVQANPLLKQLLNFSGTNTTIDNPYLVTYSINKAKTGWGIHSGFGYNYKKTENLDQPDNRVSTFNNFSCRVGVNKKNLLSKRLEAGFGIDLIGSYQKNKTTNEVIQTDFNQNTGIPSTDTTVSIITNRVTGFGFGPQGNLSFLLTNKLLIGTEASFYFISQTDAENIYIRTSSTRSNNGSPLTVIASSNSNSKNRISKIDFTLPVVLFIIIKF